MAKARFDLAGAMMLLAICAAAPALGQEPGVEVTGTWKLTLDHGPQEGLHVRMVTFVQDGDSLSGAIVYLDRDAAGKPMGKPEPILHCRVEGNELSFTVEGFLHGHDLDGGVSRIPYELAYTGTVHGDSAAGLMVRSGGLHRAGTTTEIPWTAKRQ